MNSEADPVELPCRGAAAASPPRTAGSDLHFLTITQAAPLLRDRKISPVELVASYISRAKRLDGKLNSYLLLLEVQAMAAAERAEREMAAGLYRGPLHGIPVGLKDVYDTAGVATTGHLALFRNRIPAEDATVVRLLLEAGAVVMGKLATHELGTGGPSFDLPWPPARNPWDLERVPGGSSSGSAAAVAAGLCMAALGTDGGGSIRFPAAMCGVAGFKPTFGLVSRRGILPFSSTLDHAGPMAWTAADCALMIRVLAAHDPADPFSADVPLPGFEAEGAKGLCGLRVGVVRHFHEQDTAGDAEMAAAFETAVRVFAELGAVTKPVTLVPLRVFADVCNLIIRTESYAAHERYLVATPDSLGEIARKRLCAGAFVQASDYLHALRHRSVLAAEIAETMCRVDVLVTPGNSRPAWRFDEADHIREPLYAVPFNVTGAPALTICTGLSRAGLPLSLQIAGRPFEDDVVLRVGMAFEAATGFRRARPGFASGTAS